MGEGGGERPDGEDAWARMVRRRQEANPARALVYRALHRKSVLYWARAAAVPGGDPELAPGAALGEPRARLRPQGAAARRGGAHGRRPGTAWALAGLPRVEAAVVGRGKYDLAGNCLDAKSDEYGGVATWRCALRPWSVSGGEQWWHGALFVALYSVAACWVVLPIVQFVVTATCLTAQFANLRAGLLTLKMPLHDVRAEHDDLVLMPEAATSLYNKLVTSAFCNGLLAITLALTDAAWTTPGSFVSGGKLMRQLVPATWAVVHCGILFLIASAGAKVERQCVAFAKAVHHVTVQDYYCEDEKSRLRMSRLLSRLSLLQASPGFAVAGRRWTGRSWSPRSSSSAPTWHCALLD